MYPTENCNYFSSCRREIEPLLLPGAIASALEIGCGSGATMAWLRRIKHVDHAVGVELNVPAARQAMRIFDEVIIGNVEAQSFELHQQFDLILALDVLEHLSDPWAVVRRLRKALKPGGALIASIPNVIHYRAMLPLLVKGSWQYTDEGIFDRTHLRFFSEDTAIKLFTESGFL